MPIAALPESTLRTLCSTLVLVDATAVVKELIENALDANATAIHVEISANTLDVIQVKDNGSGIAAEDRPLVCQAGSTSKIRTVEDLERLGGSSLGFRGEALASVVELSQSVVVTTRVEGEVVGSAHRYGAAGALLNSSTAAHPVGTTVRVQEFLKKIPVRKQTAVKAASRTLGSIKQTLQAYAFARPSVRLSLRVLRGKNEKANWTYGPKPGSTSLADVAANIVGQEVATQCQLRSSTSLGSEPAETYEPTYTVHALLPNPDTDSSKVNNAGHFISIDGRPVTSLRGTMKDIVKSYRSYYRHAVMKLGVSSSAADPFLCLHLTCPVGSYDVNIEPAKDEVLFTDPNHVISLAEQLFKEFYGNFDSVARPSGGMKQPKDHALSQSAAFDLLLARKTPHASISKIHSPPLDELRERSPLKSHPELADSTSHDDAQIAPRMITSATERNDAEFVTKHKAGATESTDHGKLFNMHDISDDDVLAMGPPPADEAASVQSEEELVRNAAITNPWALAKLSAPVRRLEASSRSVGAAALGFQLTTPGRGHDQSSAWSESMESGPSRERQTVNPYLPSPPLSLASPPAYQNPGPPRRPWRPPRGVEQERDEIESSPEPGSEHNWMRHKTALDKWFKPTTSSCKLPSFRKASEISDGDGLFYDLAPTSLESREESVEDAGFAEMTGAEKRRTLTGRTVNMTKPTLPRFRIPQMSAMSPGADRASLSKLRSEQPSKPQTRDNNEDEPCSDMPPLLPNIINESGQESPPISTAPSDSEPAKSAQQDLAQILDFEHRKRAVNAQHRKSQSKLLKAKLNTSQLAQSQRESMNEETYTGSEQITNPVQAESLSDPDVQSYTTSKDFEQRFGTSGGDNEISLERQSPHKNRYLAAKDRLSHSHQSPPIHIEGNARRLSVEDPNQQEVLSPDQPGVISSDHSFKLPDQDPRAYLFRHSHRTSETASADGKGSTKTGLKIRRTKTGLLPFETIPKGTATHGLSSRPEVSFPSPKDLVKACDQLGKSDKYLTLGKPQFVIWSAYSCDIDTWEKAIAALVSQHFRAKVDNGGVETLLVVPEMADLGLARRIKAHVDNNEVVS